MLPFVYVALAFTASLHIPTDAVAHVQAQTIPMSERLGLIAFYLATNGTGWATNTGWSIDPNDSSNPCMWYGLSCVSDSVGVGHISSINFDSGYYGNGLSGSLSYSPFQPFPYLQTIGLSWNPKLTGNMPEIRDNAQLTTFSAGSTGFSGSIPSDYFNGCPKLKYVYLSESQLFGVFPWASLSTATELSTLDLSRSQFTGEGEDMEPHLGTLTQLRFLDLSSNQFTGMIPMLHNNTAITTLHLGYNAFKTINQTMPDYTHLTELTNLDLSGLKLTGHMPNLDKYHFDSLRLANNQLTGEIPSFSSHPYLSTLVLSHNMLYGSLPSFSSPYLTWLDVSHNRLSGTISNGTFVQGSALSTLDLSHNMWSGHVPWSALPNVGTLRLSHSRWSGPLSLDGFPSVYYVDVSENALTGQIPPISNRIQYAYLGGNQFTGVLPTLQGWVNYFNASYNNIGGPIPSRYGDLCAHVYVSHNRVTGPLPDFSNSGAVILDLSHNDINGSIPSISDPFMCLGLSRRMDISCNQLTPPLPCQEQWWTNNGHATCYDGKTNCQTCQP